MAKPHPAIKRINFTPATAAPAIAAHKGAQIAAIAREHLRIETLTTQGLDSLDFHDCSVAGIKAALEAAYAAGAASRKG